MPKSPTELGTEPKRKVQKESKGLPKIRWIHERTKKAVKFYS
jgi:hypothetical protein